MLHYRNEIDGLRALAVAGVLLYHLDFEGGFISGGWLGVDVFFVISGYLICSLLFKEIEETGSISLSGFYLRRARRILPALLVCLVGSVPIAFIISKTNLFTQYSESLFAALLSCSNIYFWQHSGYFAADSQLVPLLHTWTLGVEEQFYFIIPMLFLWISRLGPGQRKTFFTGLFLIAVVSFCLCRYGKDFLSVEFRFYMLPTRMWELLIGMFIALLLFHKPDFRQRNLFTETLSLAALGFLGFVFVNFGSSSSFAEKSLFTSTAAAVLLATTTEASMAGRLLSLKPVRFVGAISYSLYLWHWPIIFLWNLLALKYDVEATLRNQVGVILVTGIVAALSWRFVEKPFRKVTNWKACAPLIVPAACVVIMAGIGRHWYGGEHIQFTLDESGRAEFSSFADIEKGQYPHLGPSNAPPRFILLGDSHAQATSTALMELADAYRVAGLAGMKAGTGPVPTMLRSHKKDAPPYAERWLSYVLDQKIENVVLIAKWDRHYDIDQWHYEGTRAEWNLDTAKAELRDYVQQLLNAGCHVWILDQVPYFSKDPIVMTKLHDNVPYSEDTTSKEEIHFARETLQDMVSPRLHLLDPYPILAPGGRLTAAVQGAYLYVDENHLTSTAARMLKPLFQPLFEAANSQKIGSSAQYE